MQFYENYKLLAEQIVKSVVYDFKNVNNEKSEFGKRERKLNFLNARRFIKSELFADLLEVFKIDIQRSVSEITKGKGEVKRICVNER